MNRPVFIATLLLSFLGFARAQDGVTIEPTFEVTQNPGWVILPDEALNGYHQFYPFGIPIHIEVTLSIDIEYWVDGGGKYAVRPGGTQYVVRLDANTNGLQFNDPASATILTIISNFSVNGSGQQQTGPGYRLNGNIGGMQHSLNATVYEYTIDRFTNANQTQYDARYGQDAYTTPIVIGTWRLVEGQASASAGGAGSTNGDLAQLIEDLNLQIQAEFDDLAALIDELGRDPTTELPYLALILEELRNPTGPEYTEVLDQIQQNTLSTALGVQAIGQILTADPGTPSVSDPSDSISDMFTVLEDQPLPFADWLESESILPEDGLPGGSFTLDIDFEPMNLTMIGPVNFPSVQMDVDLLPYQGVITFLRTLITIMIGVYCALRIFDEFRKL